MRAHFLVPLLALLFTSLLHADGKPLKEHGEEDESFAKEENNEEVHESKDDEEIEEIGQKKSSIETELEKGSQDNDNKIDSDSESKTEKLIDELSDNNSADERSTGEAKSEVEDLAQSSVDKKDDISEANEENNDDERSIKKAAIETEENTDKEDASEVSDIRQSEVIPSEKADEEDSAVKKDEVVTDEVSEDKPFFLTRHFVGAGAGRDAGTGAGLAAGAGAGHDAGEGAGKEAGKGTPGTQDKEFIGTGAGVHPFISGEDGKETDMEKAKVEKKSKAGKKRKTISVAKKRDEPECCHHEGVHEGEHCCHEGDACCHEAEHGHHEGKEAENAHNNHDHGYEFYEEWGEHGGHEGEHEVHHAGEEEGEHEHHHEAEHHGHHDHHDHEHEHENEHEHSEDKDIVPKQKDKEPTNTKKKEGLPNAKKWWMVGDSKHWGGRGHEHWGPPRLGEQEGWHGHGHGHGGGGKSEGHHKSHVPECCKVSTQRADKRCHCPHAEAHAEHHDEGEGGEGAEGESVATDHNEGYHFHERGHGGHNDHDHDLRGPWSFGYDGFGDDWPDWDHNQKEFEHLQELDRESHEGEHDEHDAAGHHHACKGHGHQRSCLHRPHAGIGLVAPITPPLGGPLPVPYGMPISLVTLPLPAPPAAHAHHPFRVCHDCHILKNGGSRCLCKAIKHHPREEQSTNYNHHVYIDCDATVHNYPHGRHGHQVCYHRADIPTPEGETHAVGKAKQGVVYPYVGYGPWAAYPWWGDWWGGHGNHGWGQQGGGGQQGVVGQQGVGGQQGGEDCHKCENDHHGCECDHHNDAEHEVEVEHGPSLVHHNDGHHGHHDDKGVGFSLGHGEGGNLRAYRCHDTVEAKNVDSGITSKRFCVPVGYHGGYGWPYWHGYPGVGTGLWGWGWPWIKNKVPGSKLPDKGSSNGTQPTPEPSHTKKSFIEKSTKKQTIHVGYGYASGDNYRLGYGFGGMGGVAGFAPLNSGGMDENGANEAAFSRSKIEGEDLASITFAKSHIPKPEKEKTVTGSKRGIERGITSENTRSNE